MDRTKSEAATENFNYGYNCAQSVFSAFFEKESPDFEQAFYLLNSFGGGIGRTGNLCGAYSGGLAVLGLLYGRFNPPAPLKKELLYSKIREFENAFRKELGGLTCPQLLGYDISNETERQLANNNGVFLKICPNLIIKSVELLENLRCFEEE